MPKQKQKNKEKTEKPVWLRYSEEEIKAIVLKLANKGMTAEKIGLTMRDEYGVPTVKIYSLRIKKILEEKGKQNDPDIYNLRKKLERIEEHYKKNKKDKKAERSLIITKSKLKKRENYLERLH